jgi:hypothetical protein
MLGFAMGLGVSHLGIGRSLNKVKTNDAVRDIQLKEVRHDVDQCYELHQETLRLMREIVNQNNLMIHKIIAHEQIK